MLLALSQFVDWPGSALPGFEWSRDVDGERYGVIPGWLNHQRIPNNETDAGSKLPPPPSGGTSPNVPEHSETSPNVPEHSETSLARAPQEGKGRDLEHPPIPPVFAFDDARARVWADVVQTADLDAFTALATRMLERFMRGNYSEPTAAEVARWKATS